jgi:hypothetical protein
MVNSESKYIEIGALSAQFMNEKDFIKANKENESFRSLQSNEKGYDKAKAQALYQNAYRNTRNDSYPVNF